MEQERILTNTRCKGRSWIRARRANLSQEERQCVCVWRERSTDTNRVVDMWIGILQSSLLNALILSVNHKKCLQADKRKMDNIGGLS